MNRIIILLLAMTASIFSFSQVVGGRENSETTPQLSEPTKLSGGGFVGDVNVMTGEFQASVPLGTVTTPAGLGFSLTLNHSSSFSFSQNQPMTAGIPYGDGWSTNIPTISIETDVFRKFTCSEIQDEGGVLPAVSDLHYENASDGFSGVDEGDLYWFSPMVNISGLAYGRAIFKYVDDDDNKCLVFVLNKFESSLELRYYGNKWVVQIADGTKYEFSTHLANYRAPSNQRVLFYNQSNVSGPNINKDIALNDTYSTYAETVQNVVEPKQTFSVWHCDLIYNQNTPLQGVRFVYEKFGEFNYFEEFNQQRYQQVRTSVFNASTNTDYSAYTDVFLQQVQSYVMETPYEIVELDYETAQSLVDNSIMLDFDQTGVERKDSLYNYKVIKNWGVTDNFTNWKRSKHWATAPNFDGNVNANNPYISTDGSNSYIGELGNNPSEISFNHGFLESPRIFDGSNVYPGDIYEIRTTITRPDGTDIDNGNGTLDIAVRTGTLDNSPAIQSNSFIPNSGNQTVSEFDKQKGIEVFSTFNSAVKWQMGYGQTVLSTSNFFIMPNIPSTYHGMNIQIGPGNSDIDYSADLSSTFELYDNQDYKLNLLHAYPFYVNGNRNVKAASTIGHNFGTGHPWGMMIPVYNELALGNPSWTTPQPNFEELYETWWLTDYSANFLNSMGNSNNYENTPTKFNEDVVLENVQLIRYSKNPYMLQGVKTYKVNGDYAVLPNGDKTGIELVAQKRLEYKYEDETLIRNYDYADGAPIHNEAYKRRVILLTKIREIPVDVPLIPYSDQYYNVGTPADTSEILTTFFGYTKILDNENLSYIYNQTKPYQGLNQYLLDTYVDHLGGITKVEYYPFDGNGETRWSSTYRFKPCDANIEPRQAMSKGSAYTAHVAVKYLAKNDEQDIVFDNINPFDPTLVHKVWEYQYDLNAKIYNPKQMTLPTGYFKSEHWRKKDISFGKVRVISPKLTSGEYTYTDYEYLGNPDQNDHPTLEEFLFYGKLKTMKTYDQNDVLHEEKIINYDYTLAFENAYLRPNLLREKLGYDDHYARAYEYEDVYKDEVITMDIFDPATGNTSTAIGPQTYPHIDVPILHGNFNDREQPKFLEFWFYNDLVTQNADYFFNSYFIKKTSEINRLYDNYLGKNGTTSTPVTPPISSNPANAFGTGIINPVGDDPETDDPLLLSIDNSSSTNAMNDLLANSPLSDTVLKHAISSTMRQNQIGKVLAAQMGLSNAVWNHFIDNKGKFSSSSYDLMVNAQPYFSDDIQLHLIQSLTPDDDYTFPKNLLLKNDFLSNDVITEMTSAASVFPEEVFNDVISEQSYLTEPTVLAIVNSVHMNKNTLVSALSDQVLTDEVWDAILLNPDFTTEALTELVESSVAYPSHNTLIDILDYSPAFTESEIDRIFAIMNRPISRGVEEKLLTNYPALGPIILEKPFTGNPLDQYCNNEVIEGRTYIENRTDYEYYEADYTGKAIGVAYEMLLGHRSSAEDASPYPFTQNITTETGNAISQTVNNLRLKHEPSWQVFAVQTSSPQHPEAYNREEYYYLYDLQNRYDRYWYNYDLESGNYGVTDYDPLNGIYSPDTIGYNIHWTSDYTDLSYLKLPQFDGMERSRTYGNRVLAFQKTLISKNSRDEDPLIRSEYYDYDRRWTFDDLPGEIQVATYNGDPCPTGQSNGGPCTDLYECTDCYSFKYVTDEQMQTLVQLGYCAYSSPTYGWFICPYGTDVANYAPDATLQYCNTGVSSSESPTANPLIVAQPKALQPADALAKTLLLRSVTVQIDTLDHSIDQQFDGVKMDEKNKYIAEFTLENFAETDANNFNAPYEMIYPYDHLTVRTIQERNRYLQPALEENQIGLQTKYYYNTSQALWNTNDNCTNPDYSYLFNYQSTLNEDIAKPIRITVGYNKIDSLSSTYDYNTISIVNKVTSPSGKFMEYAFDNYFRLINTKENGTRLLSVVEYNNWLHDNLDFENRTNENYVETITFNDDPTLDPLGINIETRKAFIDPLGRNHSVVSSYSTDQFTHREIHSGTVEYDNWGRVIKVYKNFNNDLTSQTAGAPEIVLNSNPSNPYAETQFENDPKGRALRTSNYGVDVNGVHAVKTSYAITNNIYASCELDLNLNELELVFGPGNTANYRFLRTEILDQDNKKSVEYGNALGQKVASLKYNDNHQRIVTLFVYDSYGNLTEVINPEKQETHYEYNILGQLVKETTVDAGVKRYMYNKQGLVSVTLDEQGQFYDPNGNGVPGNPADGTTNAFYRVYHYDDFGRVTEVGRSTVPYNYSLDQEYPFLLYETTQIGDIQNGIPENGDMTVNGRYLNYAYTNASSQDWLASFDAWYLTTGGGGAPTPQVVTISGFENLYINTLEKQTLYGGDVTSNEIGKVVKTYSYNNDGLKILKTEFTYDDVDNVATQVTVFNPNINVDLNDVSNLTSVITYPAYNYRNSLKEQTVDVDNDGTIDYHCFMEYDALNRLKAIYGAAGYASDINVATLLISYEYDDANGLIDKKKHYIDDDNGLSVLANEIDYNYDVRDRLTEIKAGLSGYDPMMHYQLFYDDDAPQYQTGTGTFEFVNSGNNWNGNINGTIMRYGLQETNIANPVDYFDEPLLYGYTYDKINRLISADATVGDYLLAGATDAERRSIGDVSIRYDRIGNILSLHRKLAGQDIQSANPVLPLSEIQHWAYSYGNGTNRLVGVNGVSGTVSRAYTYDANGNVLTDNSKIITSTEYGRAAYPFEILQDETTINYLYSANDLRVYKKSLLSVEVGNEWSEDYYLLDAQGKTVAILHKSQNDITGSWEYYASGAERECRLVPTSTQAPAANIGNTNVKFKKDQVSFYLYDHLGNTRVNYTPTGFISHPGDPSVAVNRINSVVDYFPYGKLLRHYNVTDERYLTTQHERDQETGLDYRGARYYDGDIGRFLSLDPYASDYPTLSDYCYVAANPEAFVDPDGKAVNPPPYNPFGTTNGMSYMGHCFKSYFTGIFSLIKIEGNIKREASVELETTGIGVQNVVEANSTTTYKEWKKDGFSLSLGDYFATEGAAPILETSHDEGKAIEVEQKAEFDLGPYSMTGKTSADLISGENSYEMSASLDFKAMNVSTTYTHTSNQETITDEVEVKARVGTESNNLNASLSYESSKNRKTNATTNTLKGNVGFTTSLDFEKGSSKTAYKVSGNLSLSLSP